MLYRALIVSMLLSIFALDAELWAESTNPALCMPEAGCGFSISFDGDREDLLDERQELRAYLAGNPDDIEATEQLLANLGSYSVEIHQEDGTIVRDGVQEEYRSLLRRLRHLDPDHRDSWCSDLDTPATLDEALQIAEFEPGHWLVTECLAEYLMNDSQEDLAVRLLDAWLEASGFVGSLEEPHYEPSREELTALTLLMQMGEESDEVWNQLLKLDESTGNIELRFSLAIQVLFGFEDDDLRREWAEHALLDLLEIELSPNKRGALCDWLWLDRDDEIGARTCFEELLRQGPPDETDEDWLFAEFQARDSLNEMDMERELVEPVARRIEQASAFGRMRLWESFILGVDEEEKRRACAHLAASWLRGDFEDEVLATSEVCPRRLDILVQLMTECGFEALLRERLRLPESAARLGPDASSGSAGSPAASSVDRAAD